jgi:hypothetical protein
MVEKVVIGQNYMVANLTIALTEQGKIVIVADRGLILIAEVEC